MSNFFELFELAKNSGSMADELALYNEINNNSAKFGKARFDDGYNLGFTHGMEKISNYAFRNETDSVNFLMKAIRDVLKMSEELDDDSDGNPPFTSEMGLTLNRALEGVSAEEITPKIGLKINT